MVAAGALAVAPSASEPASMPELVADEVSEAPDLASALNAARSQGREVLVGNLTDEFTTHTASPNGTVRFVQFTAPQRVRRSQGWVPVDTSISLVAGRLVPGATVLDFSLSAGGSDDLVVMSGHNGERLALSWPGPLPTPVLDGNVVTYTEVMPGVDLRITVNADSFSQVLVVKTPQAAANPALTRIAWGVAASGVTLRSLPSGAVEAVDSAGAVVFVAPPATMWDSPAPVVDAMAAAFGEPSDFGAPEPMPGVVAEIPMQVAADELAVLPDPEILTDPNTTYPVMIDPSFGAGYSRWATVNNQQVTTSYQSGTEWPRDWIRVGPEYNSSPVRVWRSFMKFNIGSMDGNFLVDNPSFTIILDHSAACADTSVQLWHTDFIPDSGVTWNSTSEFWNRNIGNKLGSANDGCSAQNTDELEWSNSILKSELQARIDHTSSDTMTLGLRSYNESNTDYWKRFKAGSAALSATYGVKPNAPAPQAFASNVDCGLKCAAADAVVRTTQPTLKASVSDGNGGILLTTFEVRASASDTATLVTGNAAAPDSKPSGGVSTWTVPVNKLVNGISYWWRAQSKDEQGLVGAWSGWQKVTIDTTAPTVSSVTSALYPFKQWGAVVGTAGSFTMSADSSVYLRFWVDNGSPQTYPASPTATNLVTSYAYGHTPSKDMVHTLYVEAVDIAGNVSAPVAHQFWVTPAANRCWNWLLNETSGTTAADSGNTDTSDPVCPKLAAPNATTPLPMSGALSGGVSFGPGKIGNGAVFTGTGQIATSGPVLDTSKSFTVMAWVKPSNLAAGDQTILSQDGTNGSRFQLHYDIDTGRWCFSMRAADNTAAPSSVCATGTYEDDDGNTFPATSGQWAHVAGTFDAVTGQIAIHVMGNPTACEGERVTGTVSGSWVAGGPLVIGRAKGSASEFFRGVIDHVYVHQKVLPDTDICYQADL